MRSHDDTIATRGQDIDTSAAVGYLTVSGHVDQLTVSLNDRVLAICPDYATAMLVYRAIAAFNPADPTEGM